MKTRLLCTLLLSLLAGCASPGLHLLGDSTPLLKTGNEWLAWARTEKNSRVAGTVLGHSCYADPNFRKLVAQSIRWAARR